MAITLTSSAAAYIRDKLAKESGYSGLRIGVKSTGCSEYSYTLEFDSERRGGDFVFTSHHINIYVDKGDLQYLNGCELNYVTKGLGKVIVFNNPNAESECGCGESFSLKK